jgi:hypothetical protein
VSGGQKLQTLLEGGRKIRSLQIYCVDAFMPLNVAALGSAQSLTAEQAKAHEGQTETICGRVAGEKRPLVATGIQL